MKNIIYSTLILLSLKSFSQDRITGELFSTRSEVIAENGMVATSHPLATQVGIDILKKGGNAIDAAIASNAAIGLMEPTGNGIGGDLFAIIWIEKDKKLYGLNASGRSPKNLTLDYFKENNISEIPWIPFSANKSWNFFIGIKSGMLSDIKYDKRRQRDKIL